MPIFSKQLSVMDYSTPEAVKSIARHLRVMQEELEYRLMFLDSSNINELNADQTDIVLDGKNIKAVIKGLDGSFSELEKTVDSYKVLLGEYGLNVKGYEEELERLTEQVGNYGEAVKSYDAQVSIFNQTVEGFTATVQGYDKAVLEYADELAELTKEVDGYNQSVKDYDAQVSIFEQTVNGFNTTVIGYEKTVEGYTAEYSSFNQTAADIQLSVKDLQTGMSQTLRMDSAGVYIVDAKGNTVTISGGQINADTLVLSGSIKFVGTSGDETTLQGAINSASTPLPTYIKNTYIDSTTIKSPTIEANEFNVYPDGTGSQGSFNIYGDFGGSQFHFLSIAYSPYFGGDSSPGVRFSSPHGAELQIGIGEDGSTDSVRFFGNVYFGNANVSGVTATFA